MQKNYKTPAYAALSSLTAFSAAHGALKVGNDFNLVGSTTQHTSWDIDGGGGDIPISITTFSIANRFALFAIGSVTSAAGFLAHKTASTGEAAIALAAMTASESVGPSQPYFDNFFTANIYNSNLYTSQISAVPRNTPTTVGFKFVNGITQYGIATFTWNLTDPKNVSLSFTNVIYDDSGAAVPASAVVPEAETTALGLAALAFGAAGLCRWRKRKQLAA